MQFYKRILTIFSHEITFHILFWIGFILIPVLLSDHHDTPNIRARVFIGLLYAGIIYLNNFYLIPTLFQKKKIIVYIASILSAISIAAILQVEYYDFIHGCDCPHQLSISNFTDSAFQTSVFLIVFVAFKIIGDNFYKEQENNQIEREHLKTELEFLKNQIQPHFLFNVLNSIYSMSRNESGKIPGIILKLSDMLRYMLYEGDDKFVLLEKEVTYINSYIDLQNLRLEGKGEIQFVSKGNISDKMIAPLLLITFIENCFKHGTEIEIFLTVEDDKLFFRTNNRTETTTDENNFGVGLKNVRKRLEIIYPQKHELKICKTDTVFAVNLTINLS